MDSILRYWQITRNEKKFYDTFGYLCLPGLISRGTAAELAEEVLHVMEGLGLDRDDLRRATTSKDKLRQSRQYLAGSGLERLIHCEELNAISRAADGRTLDALHAIHGGQERRRWRPFSLSPGQSIYAI